MRLWRFGGPETDIGPAVAFLCSCDVGFITGTTLSVDRGTSGFDDKANVRSRPGYCHGETNIHASQQICNWDSDSVRPESVACCAFSSSSRGGSVPNQALYQRCADLGVMVSDPETLCHI